MTEGSIEFACPYCERVTRVPAAYGGKQGKCPGCQRVIEVPAVDGAARAPEPPPPVVAAAAAAPTVVPAVVAPAPGPGKADAGGDDGAGLRRPCPQCGEPILVQAKKCKFCGEFLDRAAQAQARGQGQHHGGVLASVWSRLGARFVDFLICWIPACAIMIPGFMMVERGGPLPRNEPLGIGLMILGFCYFAASSFVQWYLIATRGQTIGKRLLGIQIVRNDGRPVDFVYGVLLREWLTFAVFMLPCYVGCLINTIGYAIILSPDRKCLHDHIASTAVIEAGSAP